MKARVIKPGFFGKDGEISVGTIVNVKEVTSNKLEEYSEPKEESSEDEGQKNEGQKNEGQKDEDKKDGQKNEGQKAATTNPQK